MDDEEGEALPLTSLCAICHVNAIKYTCPRCSIHTCSLACVRLHKRRAQCSGIRNPGDYVRRSDLAAPASFDRDFNFISGLERGLERAGDVLAQRRIDLRPAAATAADLRGSWRASAAAAVTVTLDRAAERRGVGLIRAPVGLTRRSENRSRLVNVSGSGGGGGEDTADADVGPVLVWTIEWLSWNGRRRVQNFDERKTLAEAYALCHPTSTATTTTTTTGKKRRRAADQVEEQTSTLIEELASTNTATTPPSAGLPPDIHLYLHRPQTRSKIKCLIPLSPTDTIGDALRGRKVVEFPTIYVRNERADELPPPFVLESTYVAEYGEDVVVPAESTT